MPLEWGETPPYHQCHTCMLVYKYTYICGIIVNDIIQECTSYLSHINIFFDIILVINFLSYFISGNGL